MAKKKITKKAAPRSSSVRKSSSGDLFKDHPNLTWLLPVLFIAFALILYMQNVASY